jgi:hypothetical protein
MHSALLSLEAIATEQRFLSGGTDFCKLLKSSRSFRPVSVASRNPDAVIDTSTCCAEQNRAAFFSERRTIPKGQKHVDQRSETSDY